jgi:hypothetical protein
VPDGEFVNAHCGKQKQGTSKYGARIVYIHSRGEYVIRKISPLIGDFLDVTSLDSTGSSKISSTNTIEFLDFAETKSKYNSWRITIHLLIFPPMTCHVNRYWKGFTTVMTVVL